MEYLSTKILVSGTVGIVILLSLYFLMAAYASSLTNDRSVGILMVKIQLSSLSDSEKMRILTDFNNYRAKTKSGLRLDLSTSNAELQKQGLSSLECAAAMIDFEREDNVCLSSIGTNPLEILFSKCPPADSLADKLKYQCAFDTSWR